MDKIFNSFFLGGFECSTQIGRYGKRHDLISETGHDKFARQDYGRLRKMNISTAREGLRWHLIEKTPHIFDFTSVLPIVRAAREHGVQILWDLFHYGFPEHVDVFDESFIKRFENLSRSFARFLKRETDETPFICPINEISFFTYAAAEHGFFAPFQTKRGAELKPHLIKATIAAINAFREVLPRTRFMQIEPAVNIIASPDYPHKREDAENYRLAQYETYDYLTGRKMPELGGNESYLDIIGINYYPYNQWFVAEDAALPERSITRDEFFYRPFRDILREVYDRYDRPMFLAETGTEDDERAEWLGYICGEVRAALADNLPVHGVCLYPILNHPGWDDDRHCHNGLWDYADESGRREVYEPLANEIRLQQSLFEPYLPKFQTRTASAFAIA